MSSLNANQIEELKAAVKAKYAGLFLVHVSKTAEVFKQVRDRFNQPGRVWSEFGHTMVECSDGNRYTEVEVLLGRHSESEVLEYLAARGESQH